MNLLRTIFYSVLIFSGILILTFIIETVLLTRDEGQIDHQLELREQQTESAVQLLIVKFQSCIDERRAALLSMKISLSDRWTLDEEDFLTKADALRNQIGGFGAIQYVSADRLSVWTSTEAKAVGELDCFPPEAFRQTGDQTHALLDRALVQARDERRTILSNATLFPSGEMGLLIIESIISIDEIPAGWLVGSLRIRTIVESEVNADVQLASLIIEERINQEREIGLRPSKVIYGAGPPNRRVMGFQASENMQVSNMSLATSLWSVTLIRAPEGEFLPSRRQYIPLLGFVISSIAGFFTFLLLSRSEKLELEVAHRMRDVQASQEELQAIIESAPMAIIGYDKTHRIFLWNPMCQAIFGYSREEAVGRLLDKLAATEAGPEMRDILLKKAFEGERLGRLSWPTKRQNGDIITCGGSLTSVKRSDREEEFVLLICNDITAQRRLESQLQKYTEHLEQMVKERSGELADSEERHRQLLSTAKDAIIGIDEKQNITLFNTAAERAFGYTASEMLNQSIWTILPQRGALGAKSGVEPFLRGGHTVRVGITREMQGRRKNGEFFPVEVSLSVFTRHDSPHFTAIIRDITERKNMDGRLEQMIRGLKAANLEMEEFTYVVSHDMKAPLRAVRNLCQFIVEDYEDKLDETGKDYLERLQESVTLMSELIDDLLQLSQITRIKTPSQPVEIEVLVDKVISILKPAENVQIRIARNLPMVTCTRAKMEQVFLNLISNGIKYNDKKTIEIEIGCEEKENYYQFYVSDNGIGIDKKYQHRIFQAFQRLHKRSEFEGSGIGLTVVKKVIMDHGGRVWMESEVGSGAKFHFTLPKTQIEVPES